MSGRIEKTRSRKRTNALILSERIDRLGFIMSSDISCSRCKSENKSCKAHHSSGKCSRCTEHGGSCDLFGPSEAEHQKLVTEEDRLDLQERLAEEELLRVQQSFNELQQHLQELFGRLARLRNQKKILRKRGIELLRKGIQGAEAMEEFERLEREQQQLEGEVAAVSQAAGVADWSGVDNTDWSTVDNLDWGAIIGASGAVGENSSGGAGHS